MNTLEELTEAQEWLQLLRPLPYDVREELRHRLEVALTYNSNAIEGNTLTQSETQILIEKGIAIGGKTVAEHCWALGMRDAIEMIDEAVVDSPLDIEQVIKAIHHALRFRFEGRDAGLYNLERTLRMIEENPHIDYRLGPEASRGSHEMAEFRAWFEGEHNFHPVELAAEAYARFMVARPFAYGNEAVGRLLMNYILVSAGYPIAVIPVTKRTEYISALEAAQSSPSDRSGLDELLRDAVAFGLRQTLAIALTASEVHIPPQLRPAIEAWVAAEG